MIWTYIASRRRDYICDINDSVADIANGSG